MDTHAFDPVRASTDDELRAHSRWLSGVARALIGEGGDDLAQDAWVAALERKPDGERGLKPWFAGALRFLASNERRTRARRATRERSVARDEALPSSDALAAEIELQRLIADAVSALDEPERSTLVRRYWHGESAAEIARRDGVPAGTVRARLSRALAKLRERLDQRFEGKRATWCALLAPLAESPRASTGSSMVTTVGAVTMSWIWKIVGVVAAAALAALLAISNHWPDEDELVLTPPAASHPAEVSVDTRDLTTPGTSESERAVAAVPSSIPGDPTTNDAAIVLVRVVDELGVPIVGAELVHEYSGRSLSALSSRDGRIRLEFDLSRAVDAVVDREFIVRAPARTVAELSARLARGRTVDLGDVVLLAAGEVRGRIVDPDGEPLAGLARAAIPELSFDPKTDARAGPPAGTRLAAAVAGPDGRFVIAAVRAGPCRVWYGSPGTRWTYTATVDVRAGETLDVGDVVLSRVDATIRGHVVGPAGEPLAKQMIVATEAGGLGYELSAISAADGAFVLFCESEGPFDLAIEDAFGGVYAEVVRGVAAGTHDVVLRTTFGLFVDVVVRDESGAPVPRYEISVSDEPGRTRSTRSALTPDGRTRVSLRPMPFWIRVSAPGRRSEQRGPFDRSALGTTVEIPLQPTASVRGRVMRAGQPVSGALVELCELAQAHDARIANEFPFVFVGLPMERARTGDDGSFTLSAPAHTRCIVVARHTGLPSARSAPFDFDGQHAVEGLMLELDAEGVLTGKTIALPGQSSAWIGISHGDGPTLVTRAGADGSFSFANLAPGRWWIRVLDHDMTDDITLRLRDAAWREPESFVIEDGRTTHIELDLSRGPALAGRLRFGARALGVWSVALEAAGSAPLARQVVTLDERGEFRFVTASPGIGLVTLTDADASGVRHEIRATVDLGPGEQRLAFEYDDATVRGRAPGCAGETLGFVRRDGAQRAFVTRVQVDAEGRFGPARTCAGTLAIVKVTPEGQLAGKVLLEVELSAGSERTLELP